MNEAVPQHHGWLPVAQQVVDRVDRDSVTIRQKAIIRIAPERTTIMFTETCYVIDGPNWAHQANSMGDLAEVLDNMIRRFLRSANPRYVVAAWDDREASFRRDLWPEYKADREPQPEKIQMLEQALGIFETHHIGIVQGYDGAEADDLIATLASRAPKDWRVAMVSSDKDLFQLLDHRTFLCRRRQGMSEIVGREKFEAKYGVEPEQWPSVMALAGAKNGVPGLPGIGLAGACELIAKYGDLETLLKKCKTVARRTYRHALMVGGEEVRLYLELMTLRRDLPIESDWSAWDWRV